MIKVYESNYCPYCIRAKDYLDLLGIEYESVNIQKDAEARDFFIQGGYRTVPQMFVNDKLLCKDGSDGLVRMTKEEIQNKMLELSKT
ncbi:MAG: glutaredoxin [Rhodospirillaceae bacterium]|jgi:glutaredoxin 3|nr:glutaredoxin [Rhodospirillaceae bacterium]MBT59732.1 glutaredoxin [Acidiferrobacteraceae bacterium]HJP12507.1 glutaredoxin [Gammaproteobacteria bacterium]|tara:strand:- start:1126 stop:1386 length:261 start_codon:yes stop_codon:yes gene_type:complete